MVVRPADRGGDGRGHRPVLNELDPRARRANVLDQVMVSRPVEDDRVDVVRAAAERVGDRLHVLAERLEQVDRSSCPRPDGHLAHVHVGQVQERAPLADRDHRHRAVAAPRDHTPALERVERKVDGLPAGPDVLADPQRGFLVRGADHDPARDGEVVQHAAHRVGRVPLGRILVGASEPACPGQRRTLGDADVLLAEAEPRRRRRLRPRLDRLLDRLGHQTRCTCSALARTNSSTASMAERRSVLETTGTP